MQSYDIAEWGQPLQSRLRDTPQPGPEEVLVRLSYCGVCHSDVHIREGWFDLGGGNKLKLSDRGTQLPLTLGHEPIGVVQAVGGNVRGVELGRQVLVNPWIGCGQCRFCVAGRDNLCNQMRALGMAAPGGFATHLLVPHARYLVDAEGLDAARCAVLACSGVTAYSAVSKFGPLAADDWVAVLGCGGVGLLALAVLKAKGHARVIACDIDDAKLAAATQAGAAATVNLKTTPGPAELLRISGGGLSHMVDFVGAPATAQLALPALLKGGQMVVVGLFGGALPVPLPALAMREVSLRGSAVGNTQQIRELVQMVRDGRLQLPEVQVRPLAAAEDSLRDLEAGRIVGRVVLDTAEDA
ncbi:MAG: alcohol dehydrogenase catalytic domain-containing protein [Burkholderiales bacterium]|nr:alcohol dehydrogenase catalytic domain-containing protein [Burkholderiales bacterium]